MNGLLVKVVGSVMALGLLGGGGTFAATQQADVNQIVTQDTPPQFEGERRGRGQAFLRHLQGQITDLTGMTGCEILEQRASGESLESILESAGLDPAEVQANALDALEAKLNEAVAGGNITQAQADRVMAAAPDRLATFMTNTETDRAERLYERVCANGEPGARAANIVGTIEEQTGLDRCTIAERRASGESFAQILESVGIDADTVSAEIIAQLEDALSQAVADGKITQERADQMLAAAPERIEQFLTNTETDRAERLYERVCGEE